MSEAAPNQTSSDSTTSPEVVEIDLRDPVVAGVLAWLLPGAGHFYQGRNAKGVLFLICILGTFMYGMFLGDGRVVYAQWEPREMRRYPFLCQICVGLPSLPALFARQDNGFFGKRNWYAPPSPSQLSDLQRKLNRRFELGTVFTMIAGLLNVLAIYDAFAGPVFPEAEESPADGTRGSPPGGKGEKSTA